MGAPGKLAAGQILKDRNRAAGSRSASGAAREAVTAGT
jgi:hypothetical protein